MKANESITPALMKTKEACKYLGSISERTLYDLVVIQKRIQAVTISPRLKMYERTELDRFIADCRGGAK